MDFHLTISKDCYLLNKNQKTRDKGKSIKK